MSATPESIVLRKPEFFSTNSIKFIGGVEVTKLDTNTKAALLSNGNTINYSGVLIASGAAPRLIGVPGKELANIYPVRVPEESSAIYERSEGKNVVVVGSSFIGMEAAACLAKRAKSIVVIGMERVPFERVLGAKIGEGLQKMFEAAGIQFRLNQKPIKEFKGSNGALSAVVLDSGEELPADVAIIGAGVIPSTNYITDIEKGRDGGILTDQVDSRW